MEIMLDYINKLSSIGCTYLIITVDRLALSRYLRYDKCISTLTPRVLIHVVGRGLIIMKGGIMATKLQPMGERVLVKPIEKEEKTKSGIYLPDTVKEKPQEGQVIAVGPGKMSEDGKRIAMDIKVGDRVLYAKYGGTEIKVDDVEMIILRESDILAKKT